MRSAVIGGRGVNAKHALKVLKSDLFRLLSDYFVFDPRDLKMEAQLGEGKDVVFSLSLNAREIKDIGRTLDEA